MRKLCFRCLYVMQNQVASYISFIAEKQGKSLNTQLSYRRDLCQLLAWLSNCGITTAAAVGPSELRAYIAFLQESGKSAATVSRSVASVKAFFGHLEASGQLAFDPSAELKAPRVEKKAPALVGEREIQKLLKQPDEHTLKGIRDKAMLELLCDTGLRVSELIGLQCPEVDLKRRVVVVNSSKCRVVPYSKRISKYLSRYEREARKPLLDGHEETTYFVNCAGEAMTRQGFWKLLKKYGEAAGIESEITPHAMRHSFAVRALKSGEDYRHLQEIMGHSDAAAMHAYQKCKVHDAL